MSFSFEGGRVQVTKHLRDLARHCGAPLCRCLVVDDSPETYRLNQSNALPVPSYDGSSSDRTLLYLRDFLLAMPRLGIPLDVSAWPLAPRGAQPLLAAHEDEREGGGYALGSASTCARDQPKKSPPTTPPAFLPAFLPPPEEDEMNVFHL